MLALERRYTLGSTRMSRSKLRTDITACLTYSIYNFSLPEQLHLCSVDQEWKGLTNALAGLLCASLNFVDPSNSMSPEFSFRPTGVVEEAPSSSHLRYSSLPREIVCTENLTPFKKLLPCDSKVPMHFCIWWLFIDTFTYDEVWKIYLFQLKIMLCRRDLLRKIMICQ